MPSKPLSFGWFAYTHGDAVGMGGLFAGAYPIGEGKRRIWRYLRHDLAEWMLGRRNTGLEPCNAEASSGMYTRGSHRCSHPGVLQ